MATKHDAKGQDTTYLYHGNTPDRSSGQPSDAANSFTQYTGRRLSAIQYSGGYSELFEYDPIDSVVSKQLFVQTGLSQSGVTMRVGVAGNPTYDAAGRTSTLSFPGFNYYLASAGNTGGYGNAVKFQYGYAPGNRVASVTQWASMSQALYYVYRGNSWPHRDSKRSIPHVWSGVHKPIN